MRIAKHFGCYGALGSLLMIAGCNLILGIDEFVDQKVTSGTGGGGGHGGQEDSTTTSGTGGNDAPCTDGMKNGDETDSDCGGETCAPCPDGRGCTVGPDCVSKVCIGGTCAAPECTDKIQNSNETDVDCGGGMCPTCGPRKTCGGDQDCKSASCAGGSCESTCSDGVKGGSEADADCGGPSCPACADGQACAGGLDCSSGVCKAGICISHHVWSERFGVSGDTRARDVALDSSGNIVVPMNIDGSVDLGGGPLISAGSDDVVLAKFNTNGGHIWSKRFGDTALQSVSGAATDGTDNIAISGSFDGTVNFGGGALTSAGKKDVFIAKFSSAGSHIWSARYGDAQNDQSSNDVAADKAGNTIVVGEFAGTLGFGGTSLVGAGSNDAYVAKFGLFGTPIWSKKFGDAMNQSAAAVTVDAQGNIIMTGHFAGTVDFGGGPLVSAGLLDIFIVKFDSSGSHLWSKRYGDAQKNQMGRDIAATKSGDIVLLATGQGTIDFGGGPLAPITSNDPYDEGLVVMFDEGGNHLWSKRFDSFYYGAPRITTDDLGNVTITGPFWNTTDFGGGPLVSVGNDDIFVTKLDTNGGYLWSRPFGGIQSANSAGIAANINGQIVVTGSFAGTIDFGGAPLSSISGLDLFLTTLQLP